MTSLAMKLMSFLPIASKRHAAYGVLSHSMEKRSTLFLHKVYYQEDEDNQLTLDSSRSFWYDVHQHPWSEHIFCGGYFLWTDFNVAFRLRVASCLPTWCCAMPGL